MQDEEREYQEFLAKTINASKKFADDYNNLSPTNKMRFQKLLETKVGFDILNYLITMARG